MTILGVGAAEIPLYAPLSLIESLIQPSCAVNSAPAELRLQPRTLMCAGSGGIKNSAYLRACCFKLMRWRNRDSKMQRLSTRIYIER